MKFGVRMQKGIQHITSVAETVDFNFGADPNGQVDEYMKLITGREESRLLTQREFEM